MIYISNVSKQIKLFKNELIKECIHSTLNRRTKDRSYLVYSIHTKKLYQILIKHCNKYLNKFTIRDNNFLVCML